jgi:hypothetical protein
MAHTRRAVLATLISLSVLAGSGCTTTSEVAAPPAAGPVPADVAPPGTGLPPPPRDLRPLLITPADIPVPGFLPPVVQPLAEDAVDGLVARFDSAEGERQLGTTIVLLPDPAAAQDAMLGAASSTQEQRAGAGSAAAQVGDRAVIFTGYELAGTASTLLLFSQGTASVAMEFRSPSTDPIPTEAVVEAGNRQAARLKPAFG